MRWEKLVDERRRRKLTEAQKMWPTKMYEGLLTNKMVATHLWCPFKVKGYFRSTFRDIAYQLT
jgi:hypothetical protein